LCLVCKPLALGMFIENDQGELVRKAELWTDCCDLIHRLIWSASASTGLFLVCPVTPLSPAVILWTTRYRIQKLCVMPTQCLCVLCGSQNKQRLFPCTALTVWFL
jgi:hypothetical protein